MYHNYSICNLDRTTEVLPKPLLTLKVVESNLIATFSKPVFPLVKIMCQCAC